MHSRKFDVGLVVGRFQPFHNGHTYLIQKALELCDVIIIGIGSSNVTDDKNPYSFTVRRKFIKEFVENEGIGDRVLRIVSVPDHPDDDVWLKTLLRKTGPFDVSIGDNAWVNGIFEKAGISVVRVGFHERETLEGTKIRSLIKDKKEWEKRVPEYLVKHIK